MPTFAKTVNGISFYKSDRYASNGAPRFIVHFPAFLRPDEDMFNTYGGVCEAYSALIKRARAAGFKKYHCREFGGGFIINCYSCDLQDLARRIEESRLIDVKK